MSNEVNVNINIGEDNYFLTVQEFNASDDVAASVGEAIIAIPDEIAGRSLEKFNVDVYGTQDAAISGNFIIRRGGSDVSSTAFTLPVSQARVSTTLGSPFLLQAGDLARVAITSVGSPTTAAKGFVATGITD